MTYEKERFGQILLPLIAICREWSFNGGFFNNLCDIQKEFLRPPLTTDCTKTHFFITSKFQHDFGFFHWPHVSSLTRGMRFYPKVFHWHYITFRLPPKCNDTTPSWLSPLFCLCFQRRGYEKWYLGLLTRFYTSLGLLFLAWKNAASRAYYSLDFFTNK